MSYESDEWYKYSLKLTKKEERISLLEVLLNNSLSENERLENELKMKDAIIHDLIENAENPGNPEIHRSRESDLENRFNDLTECYEMQRREMDDLRNQLANFNDLIECYEMQRREMDDLRNELASLRLLVREPVSGDFREPKNHYF